MSTTELKNIANKFNSVIGETEDCTNKINTVKGRLSNFLHKINTVKSVLSTINNLINTLKAGLYNLTNDIRTRGISLKSIENDIRFIKSWQKSGAFGFQSLGKSYIHVYIDGVDQIDIDIDSITITKSINSEHTATFDLARAYDSTQPTKEQLVLIKYNDWILYRGYIVSVSPISSPEKITIECKDEFWKQNQTNKYFFIGNAPIGTVDTYYSTIASALTAELSYTPGVGDFVPQSIDCYSKGISDILADVIQQCGNYAFYYDINGYKTLWTAGVGDIIDLQVQAIGTNLGLYQIIKHSIKTDVSSIINKFHVLMGDRVVRRNGLYTYYKYAFVNAFCTPNWDSSYERLAKNESSGTGVDWHNSEDNDLYKDVYRVWKLPTISANVESWSDRFQPEVWVYNNFYNYFNIYTSNEPLLKLKEGFTIDYENGLLIFNEPLFLSEYSSDTKYCNNVKAPGVMIKIWKKTQYSKSDITSPLVFDTAVMGSYPITIQKDLSLSDLSIQTGGSYTDSNGIVQIVPSWDDSAFALDKASWELSKICDEKTTGTIDITLDALCFYNLDLTKRIHATGILDTAVNIVGMTYNLSTFMVTLQVESFRAYKRTVSYQYHGE